MTTENNTAKLEGVDTIKTTTFGKTDLIELAVKYRNKDVAVRILKDDSKAVYAAAGFVGASKPLAKLIAEAAGIKCALSFAKSDSFDVLLASYKEAFPKTEEPQPEVTADTVNRPTYPGADTQTAEVTRPGYQKEGHVVRFHSSSLIGNVYLAEVSCGGQMHYVAFSRSEKHNYFVTPDTPLTTADVLLISQRMQDSYVTTGWATHDDELVASTRLYDKLTNAVDMEICEAVDLHLAGRTSTPGEATIVLHIHTLGLLDRAHYPVHLRVIEMFKKHYLGSRHLLTGLVISFGENTVIPFPDHASNIKQAMEDMHNMTSSLREAGFTGKDDKPLGVLQSRGSVQSVVIAPASIVAINYTNFTALNIPGWIFYNPSEARPHRHRGIDARVFDFTNGVPEIMHDLNVCTTGIVDDWIIISVDNQLTLQRL